MTHDNITNSQRDDLTRAAQASANECASGDHCGCGGSSVAVAEGATRIALVGSPNTGKTSIFNQLTGLRARTGNYPGVTVGRSLGPCEISTPKGPQSFAIEDLPGTYSLQPMSPDEQIVVDVLSGTLAGVERPDAQLIVVDATVLERSMALVAQALAIGLPTAIVLTMTDELYARGGHIDADALSTALGVPVVKVVATKKQGIAELKQLLTEVHSWPTPLIAPPTGLSPAEAEEFAAWHRGVAVAAQYRPPSADARTAKIDRIVLHPIWGTALFFAVMFAFFQVIFTVAAPIQDAVEGGVVGLGEWATSFLPEGMLTDFVNQAIIGGVGGVVVFIPQIMLLFLLISLLEQIGYLARAAFLMDRVMAKSGIEGRAFVAMLSSFACAVPGIMAARTLPSERHRIITALTAPLMTCSARIPVYILLTAMLVPSDAGWGPINAQGLVMFGMYLLGGLSALVASYVFSRTALKGSLLPFYMELPPYRIPSVKSVLLSMWDSALTFLKKVATIIFATSVVLWILLTLPLQGETPEGLDEAQTASYTIEHSYGAAIGKAIEPVFEPLGFDWRINISLVGAQAAREVAVSTLGQIAAAEDPEDPQANLETWTYLDGDREGEKVFTAPTVAALLVFFAYALQCTATVGAIRRETNSWKWAGVAFAYMFVLAWVGAWIAHSIAVLITGAA